MCLWTPRSGWQDMKERKHAAKKTWFQHRRTVQHSRKTYKIKPLFRVFQVQNPPDIRDGSRRLNPPTYLTFPNHPKSKREEPSIHIHSPAMFEPPLPAHCASWLHRCGRLAGPLFRRCAGRGTSAVEIPPKLGEAASRWGIHGNPLATGHKEFQYEVTIWWCLMSWMIFLGFPCDSRETLTWFSMGSSTELTWGSRFKTLKGGHWF